MVSCKLCGGNQTLLRAKFHERPVKSVSQELVGEHNGCLPEIDWRVGLPEPSHHALDAPLERQWNIEARELAEARREESSAHVANGHKRRPRPVVLYRHAEVSPFLVELLEFGSVASVDGLLPLQRPLMDYNCVEKHPDERLKVVPRVMVDIEEGVAFASVVVVVQELDCHELRSTLKKDPSSKR